RISFASSPVSLNSCNTGISNWRRRSGVSRTTTNSGSRNSAAAVDRALRPPAPAPYSPSSRRHPAPYSLRAPAAGARMHAILLRKAPVLQASRVRSGPFPRNPCPAVGGRTRSIPRRIPTLQEPLVRLARFLLNRRHWFLRRGRLAMIQWDGFRHREVLVL